MNDICARPSCGHSRAQHPLVHGADFSIWHPCDIEGCPCGEFQSSPAASDAPRWIVAHPEIPGPKTMVCSHCGKLPGYATHQGNPENYCICDQHPSDAPRTEPVSESTMQDRSAGVTLEWVRALPLKMQSVLFSGLRGPDTGHYPHIKMLVRWLRPITQVNADASTDYMRTEELPPWSDLQKELEFTSFHYFEHLALALEIVMYKHPDVTARDEARRVYAHMIDLLHANCETEEQMDERLGGERLPKFPSRAERTAKRLADLRATWDANMREPERNYLNLSRIAEFNIDWLIREVERGAGVARGGVRL